VRFEIRVQTDKVRLHAQNLTGFSTAAMLRHGLVMIGAVSLLIVIFP
jgi:hypothetical protein